MLKLFTILILTVTLLSYRTNDNNLRKTYTDVGFNSDNSDVKNYLMSESIPYYILLHTQGQFPLLNFSLSHDGRYAIGMGTFSDSPLQEALYVWELPQEFDDTSEYITLYPSYQRIDEWTHYRFWANNVISPDSHYILTHSQTSIEVTQLPDLTPISELSIPATTTRRTASWSSDGQLIAFIINDTEQPSRLMIWDWMNDTLYENVVENYSPTFVTYINNQWLFWRYKSFMLCTQFLEMCNEYRTDSPLDFVYPVKDGMRIIGGDRIENDIYQITYWDLETDTYVETLGPIVNFGSTPVIPSQDGSYFSTSFNIFEANAWRGVIELEQFGGAHQIFTSDNRFLVGFDFENLLVFDVATGSLIDSLDISGKFTELAWSEIDLEYTQLKSISDDGKWVVMILGPAGALIPMENSGIFP